MSTTLVRSLAPLVALSWLGGCGDAAVGAPATSGEPTASTQEALGGGHRPHAVAFDYANVDTPIAGVAGERDVVFVGEPLDGSVIVLSRLTGQQIGQLTPPSDGFAIPFIIHTVGPGLVTILGAGGLPQPQPFVPANPFLYEYSYTFSQAHGFSATLEREVSFQSAFIGFSEDFVHLDDGRYLVSDSVLGSVWVLEPDDTVVPGIIPQTFDPQNWIPLLALCPTMPEVTVNGYPFLFTGSTIPGISPMAVRDGIVYYFSPCARGIYSFPLSILTDNRQPWERAADISLVAATPADIEVEELLDFSFNPFNPHDRYLYAAHPMQLEVIRVDLDTGERQVVAGGARLFDFPSSLGFLPPRGGDGDGVSELAVVSNQQERTPLTNDAVTTTTFNLPFIVAKILVAP